VVASSGTALTLSQLSQLKRLTDTIIFSFDADAAGLEAARRGMRLARSLGLDIRVTILPHNYKDPDELVQKEPERWREVVKKTVPSMQFLIEKMTQGKDLRQVDDKRAVSSTLLPELADIQDAVEREHWLRIIADLLQTDMHVLRASLKPTSPSPQPAAPSLPVAKPALSKEEKASMLLIGCGMLNQEWMERLVATLPEEELVPFSAQTLYRIIKDSYHKAQPLAHQLFFARLREELGRTEESRDLIPLLDASTLSAEPFLPSWSPKQAQAQLDLLVQLLHEFYHKEQKRALAAQLRQAEQAGDVAKAEEILRQSPET
jgi:DNA primase